MSKETSFDIPESNNRTGKKLSIPEPFLSNKNRKSFSLDKKTLQDRTPHFQSQSERKNILLHAIDQRKKSFFINLPESVEVELQRKKSVFGLIKSLSLPKQESVSSGKINNRRKKSIESSESEFSDSRKSNESSRIFGTESSEYETPRSAQRLYYKIIFLLFLIFNTYYKTN